MWVTFKMQMGQIRDETMAGPDLSVFINPVSDPDSSLTQSVHVFEFGIN